MKTLTIFLACSAIACAQDQGVRSDYVSGASFTIGTYQPKASDYTPAAMASAAEAFLEALDDESRERVMHSIDSPERRSWTNLPAREGAGGLRLGACNDTQVRAFCDLLAAIFSKQGYAKMCQIMLADDQLLRGGRARPGFGTENFSVVIFGKPSATDPWAFQLDGHHVGVNVAIEGERVTMSPSFIGTQPEAFHIAARKYRPLAGEIDEAFELVNSLTDDQRVQGILSNKRGRIKTGPGTDGETPVAQGVSCASFNAAQKKTLLSLISQWVGDLPPQHAAARMKQLADEIDQTHFAWFGSTEAQSDVSYSIQGPSLIIEYACQDLGGNPLDHLHTMYRDPTNEYGGQLAD